MEEILQLAHFSKSDSTADEEILQKAEQIKQRQIQEEITLSKLQADNREKIWYAKTMNKLQDELKLASATTLNIEELTQKFELEKSIEKQKIQEKIKAVQNGICLHLDGTKKSSWITDRYDSHGYQLTLCVRCGATM
jgi:Zn-dependent metalloprotease